MTNKDLLNKITEKVHEIQALYYKEYPEGDYLNIVCYRECMTINNRYFGDDAEFPINYWDVITEDDLKSIFEDE